MTIKVNEETASLSPTVVVEKDNSLIPDPAILNDPRYMTWHDRIQHYCDRNNLTEQDNEFFSGLLTEAILACSATEQTCKCGHPKARHSFFSDHDECYDCDQESESCCSWFEPNPITQGTASPKERNPTTVPDHSPASPSESSSLPPDAGVVVSETEATLAEIRERAASAYFPDRGRGALADVDTLLSIIDSLQAEKSADSDAQRLTTREASKKALADLVQAEDERRACAEAEAEKAEKWMDIK